MSTELYGAVEVWLRHPKSGPSDPPILVTHPDTLARCLSEGWTPYTAPIAAPPAGAATVETVGVALYATPVVEAPPAPAQRVLHQTTKPEKPVKGARHGRS